MTYTEQELCKENCKFLSPKESEQSAKEFHICKKYNKRILHNGRHPFLIKCAECILNLRRIE